MSSVPLLRKATSYLVIAALVLSVLIPLINSKKASAYSLPTSRYVKLSSSQLAGTDVYYEIGFTPSASQTIGGVVVDFCQNTPIISDSCTAPTGFNLNKLTVAVAATTLSGFALDSTNTTANKLVFTKAVAQTTVSAAITITLGSTGGSDGVTNPSDLDNITGGNQQGSFYARVFTYTTEAAAQGYTSASVGSPTDAGGVAMSTAAQITITAKVQERLSFCVYTGANCAAGGTSVTLGDSNGVLDPSTEYIDKNGKYDVSTNATGNVAIRVKGDTLKTGALDITEIGGTNQLSSAGSEQFGFCTYQATGSGLTPASPYDHVNCSATTQGAGGAAASRFAFDTSAVTGTMSTYGQTFASKAPGTTSQGILAFIGNISFATEAGIYTTSLTFIATGTY